MNKNDNIVVVLFGDKGQANAAIDNLKAWDKRVSEVKLGTIGMVTNINGAIKTEVAHVSIFNRSLPISDEAVVALGNELSEEQVAVVVAADDFEVQMVIDSLVRDGGKLKISTLERTPEEIAAEKKAAADAAVEQAVRTQTEKDKRPSSYNVNKAM